jgi:hypothetical protein
VSSTGVVEHLDKTPERWAFLLRAADGSALNVELRGKVYGTLADTHTVELLESRLIEADEVIVARRMRNLTLGSMVTARQPGRGSKVAAFLVPQSIWTPIGGIGATVLGYVVAGGDASKNAQEPSDTPEPIVPGDGDGFPVVPVVLIAAVLVVITVVLLVRRRRPAGASPPMADAAPRRSSGAARLAFVVIAGLLIGIGLNVLIT